MSETTNATKAPARNTEFLTAVMIRERYLPISDRTFERWVITGAFPKPDYTPSQRMKLWHRETVEAWVESKKKPPTSGG